MLSIWSNVKWDTEPDSLLWKNTLFVKQKLRWIKINLNLAGVDSLKLRFVKGKKIVICLSRLLYFG